MFKQAMKNVKRVFAMLLTAVMIITAVPMNANAVTTNEEGYIEVRTIEDLYNIRNDLTANYILMNDIDLTVATADGGTWDFMGNGWNPIGSKDIYSNDAFSGIFEGNGYAIIGMRINATSFPSGTGSYVYAGLFANVTGEVHNLEMRDVNITIKGGSSEDKLFVGAITASNLGTISNSSVSGTLYAEACGNSSFVAFVGAVAGYNYNQGTISKCYNTANVTLYNGNAGGIAGYNQGKIDNSYNTAQIKGTYNNDEVAGIAGENYGSSAKRAQIINCYNIGTITTKHASYASAIAYGNSYSAITQSYYLTGTGAGSTGATSLTSAQSLTQSLYAGFDFDTIWEQNTNAIYAYPQLQTNPQDNRDVLEAKIETLPNKTTFIRGQALDITGCTLLFTYSNADDEIVYVTEDMVSGYNPKTVGTQELTITYNSKTFTFNVLVEEKEFKEVYTILDLYNIRYDLDSNYILMNDIDLTAATAEGGEWDFDGRGWNPIGSKDIYSNEAFSGIFDGNGYSIIGMRINVTKSNLPSGYSSASIYEGLFATVTGEVRNLEMRDVNIKAYGTYTGAITASNKGVITACSVSGSVSGTNSNTGGITGYNSGIVLHCFNKSSVTGDESKAGGITAYNRGTIKECYNTGTIVSRGNVNNTYAGGIAGYSYGESGAYAEIYNCYNIGTVNDYLKSEAYAIAYNYNNAYTRTYNTYYLSDTGVGSSGAIALNKEQLKIASVFEGFDFENIWYLDTEANYKYPQIRSNTQDIRVIDTAIIYSLPNDLVYIKGEAFDPTGLELEIKYKNAETEYVAVTSDMVSGYESQILGIQRLSVTYLDRTFVFEVTVNEKPFIEISTIRDLYNIRNDLSANYILMNDIDLTTATSEGGEWDFDGRGWNPIGSKDIYSNEAFSGIFDGNGYAIIGMRLNGGTGSKDRYFGLFAYNTGEIRNLEMRDVNITGVNAEWNLYVGAIVAKNEGTITNCSVSGLVSSSSCRLGYRSYIGGITGYNTGKGNIGNCYNIAQIISGDYAGGIAGSNDYGTIKNSYNMGKVIAQDGNSSYSTIFTAGGIAGNNRGGKIVNCYNMGEVNTVKGNASDKEYKNAVSNEAGTITDSYYLVGTGTGQTGATPLTETQMRLEEMFAGFDFENTWTINSYANHPYPQLKSNIQDLNETVTLIRLTSYPAKRDYLTGDALDMLGGMFEAVYVSGKIDVIALSNEYVTGYNPETVGIQTLTVTYGGQTDTFDINVTQRPIATSVTLVTEPTQKQFVVGTTFDFTGATIKVEYDDNSSEVMDVTADMVTGTNINKMGTQTVTVTVDEQTTTFEIEVIAATIAEIIITNLPNKVVYIEGETLDTTGLAIAANYTNGSTISIASGYTVSGYDANKIGEQTITVDFMGNTATYTITVNEKLPTNIEIQAQPDKVNYIEGEELDLTGMVVVAAYASGELDIVEDYTVSDFDSTAGVKVITVSYKGKSASFSVVVSLLTVEKIEITRLPAKLAYIENEALNTEGLVVTASFNDGRVEEVTDYEITGFSSLPGIHTLYVTYGGQVTSFDIEVSEKVLSDVRVTLPTKTSYNLGEAFDPTGMLVVACYNNGQEVYVEDYQMSGFDSSSAGAKNIEITYGGITRNFAIVVEERTAIESNGSFILENHVARLGEEVRIPVSVSSNVGIAGFRHEISFNAANLKFTGLEMQGDYKNGTLILNEEKAGEGKLTIVWFSGSDVNAIGPVYELVFEVQETAVDGITEVKLTFAENDNGNVSGENVIFGSQDGSVDVRSYWLGDLNGDRKYAMVDLVMLAQHVAGMNISPTEKMLLSADVNEDTIIDIHDVILLNQWLLVQDI